MKNRKHERPAETLEEEERQEWKDPHEKMPTLREYAGRKSEELV
jgi:hypothetical protein